MLVPELLLPRPPDRGLEAVAGLADVVQRRGDLQAALEADQARLGQPEEAQPRSGELRPLATSPNMTLAASTTLRACAARSTCSPASPTWPGRSAALSVPCRGHEQAAAHLAPPAQPLLLQPQRFLGGQLADQGPEADDVLAVDPDDLALAHREPCIPDALGFELAAGGCVEGLRLHEPLDRDLVRAQGRGRDSG